jgi:hypothetical protein
MFTPVRTLSIAAAFSCTSSTKPSAERTPASATPSLVDTAGADTAGADIAGPNTAGADTAGADTGAGPASLSILLANTGNLDEASGGPCPAAPYHGSTCSRTQEAELSATIAALAPDIAVLLEVFDMRDCETDDWVGAVDRVCTDADTTAPYQSARRLLGDAYTISCDANAHRSCVGARTNRLTMANCEAGALCMAGSTTGDHPIACAGQGAFTSVSRVDLRWAATDTPFALIAAHPLNATDATGDACRLAQYEQAFSTLPGDTHSLIAGDMNMDPYRFPDLFPSAEYWHTQIGEGARFFAHSVDESPPTPTWMGLATLDYVLSDFLEGSCTVLEGDVRLDPVGQSLDHRAVLCAALTLDWVRSRQPPLRTPRQKQ